MDAMANQRVPLLLSLWLLVGGCSKPAPSPPPAATPNSAAPAQDVKAADPAAARAANRQGMQHYRKKALAQAAASFRAAIAADTGHVLAHYNLACVLSLMGDRAGATQELEWLARSPDPRATRTLAKASGDKDLAALRDDPKVKPLLEAAAEKALLLGFTPLARGESAGPTDVKALGPLAEEHKAGLAVAGDVVPKRPGRERVALTLGGAVLLSATGEELATAELAEVFAEAKGGEVGHLWLGQVVPDDELEVVAHVSWNGRRVQGEDLLVLKRKGDKLAPILQATLQETVFDKEEGDDEYTSTDTTREVELRADGTIVTTERAGRGKRQVTTLRWDAGTFTFHSQGQKR